jgi:hypothetical protein
MKMCLIAKNLSILQNKIVSVNIWVLQNYKQDKVTPHSVWSIQSTTVFMGFHLHFLKVLNFNNPICFAINQIIVSLHLINHDVGRCSNDDLRISFGIIW